MSTVPGAKHAEAGGTDSLQAATARAARRVSGAVKSHHSQRSGRRYREPLSHGGGGRKRSAPGCLGAAEHGLGGKNGRRGVSAGGGERAGRTPGARETHVP